MRFVAIAAAAALLAGPASAGLFGDDCQYKAARSTDAPASGITRVVIHADAGSLQVDGTAGATQIVASGTACTSDDDFIERMTLTMRRSGSELHVDAVIPDKKVFFGSFSARIDFTVTLPAGMAIVIDDDSGWMKVSNTGPTTIEDDSGAIEIKNVRGPLTVNDDSGSIEIDTVFGNVKIEDDSGEIIVKNVNGSVEIEDDSGAITVSGVGSLHIHEDDSGSITASNIRRDVLIDRDSSGSIDVADVGGNFTVRRKSSGHIAHTRVAGRVDIPVD